MNPGGSVKDRAASAIVLEAERRGELCPGGTVVEAQPATPASGSPTCATRAATAV